MYKEYVKTDKKTKIAAAVIIAASLAGALIVDMLYAHFSLPFHSVFQLILLIVLASGVYIIIRNIITDYIYLMDEDWFSVVSKLGENEREVVRFNMNDIKKIEQNSFHTKHDGLYNAKKSPFSKNTYSLFFTQNKKIYRLDFEPSEKLLHILKSYV